MRSEYSKYFEALEAHPRSLVGTTVPSTRGEGTEVLRDAADAREWQDEVKHLLKTEIEARVSQARDGLKSEFETVHESIALFRNNPDLVPHTKQFDKELADRFVKLAEAYEKKIDGKLVGYSVPVQPLINSLRAQIEAERAAKAATPPPAAAPAPQTSARAEAVAQQPRAEDGRWEGPQAGITSKAGTAAGSTTNNDAEQVLGAFARMSGFSL